MRLKKLLLDDKRLPNPASTSDRRRSKTEPPSAGPGRKPMLFVTGLTVAIIALALSIIFGSKPGAEIVTNPATLCPLDEKDIVSETYIHIDLSEGLSEEQRGWLKQLLSVAQNNQLPSRSLFSISQMQTKATAPRVEVQRFCTPDISGIGAAGRRIKKENCRNIVEEEFDWERHETRNVGRALREQIESACKNYIGLNEKVQEAADRYEGVFLGQKRSYIIGGIEDIVIAAHHSDNPRILTQLIVFSDMLQNAGWFSQYRTSTEEWDAKSIRKLRKTEGAIKEMGSKPPPANLKFNKVLLCVIPSKHHALESARNEKSHKTMWMDYFKDKVVQPTENNFQSIPASACAVAAGELMRQTL